MSRSAEEIARETYEAWRADDDRADLTIQWEMLRPQHRALYVRLVVAGRTEAEAVMSYRGGAK